MADPTHRTPAARASRTPRHGWLRPVVLVVVSGTVALAAAEVLLRVTGLAPPTGSLFTVDRRTFETIPGIFEPGQDQIVREIPDLPYHVTIDSLGYRGAAFPRRPEGDEFRIFFAGDSGVFGSFVDDGETLPARTEALLRDRCRAPVRVINAGLGGSTIRDQAELIRRGLELEPDLVVLMFSENDVRDLVGPSMWAQLTENRHAKSRFPLSWIYPVARHSALWNLALKVRAVFRNRQIDAALGDGNESDPGATPAPPSDSPPMGEGRDTYRELLEGLRDELAAHGLPLVFALYPSHHTVYGTWDWDQFQWVESLGREVGLPTVSFLEPLMGDGRDETELYLLPDDGHPSPAGYALAAATLVEALVASELTPGTCA